VDVLRLAVALVLAGAVCALLWSLLKGRWRWFAAAVTVHVAVATLILSDPNLTDSWGVVAEAVWIVFLALVFASVLIAPAILLWAASPRALFSVVLALLWVLAVYTAFVVGPVWARWDVCLPPGGYYGPNNGGPSCELGPL
jgi:hypothetical protein